MKGEIRDKLRVMLESCALGMDEAKVTYILVEMRKILEHDNFPDVYKTMKFYCDWVVHSKLNGPGAGRFLEEADNIIARIKDGAPHKDVEAEIVELISFQRLASEMCQFCEDYGLPTNVCDVMKQRIQFFDCYLRVIHNCPLRYEGDKVDLKHVKKLTISTLDMKDVEPEVADSPLGAFGVKFDIEMTDPDQRISWQSTIEFQPHQS
jgi:hypothetical protein